MTGARARGRIASQWLLPAVAVPLLALAATSVDWTRVVLSVSHADPTLLGLATAANLGTLALKGVRWSVFLGAAGVPGVGYAVRATFAGAALNNVVIANGGDAARIASVARHGRLSTAPVLATVALDRFCDLITYGALFVVSAFAFEVPADLARWRAPGLVVIAALLTAVAVLPRMMPRWGQPGDAALSRTPISLSGRWHAYWHGFTRTSSAVATRPRLTLAILLSLGAWAGQWATYHYAALSAAFPVRGTDSLVALVVVNASFLVRVTPGNVGIFQVLYVLAVGSAGLNRNDAVAVALLIQMIQYIPVTFVGLLLTPSLVSRRRPATVLQPPRTATPSDPR